MKRLAKLIFLLYTVDSNRTIGSMKHYGNPSKYSSKHTVYVPSKFENAKKPE